MFQKHHEGFCDPGYRYIVRFLKSLAIWPFGRFVKQWIISSFLPLILNWSLRQSQEIQIEWGFFYFKIFIYLLLEMGEGRERNIRPSPQPRHVPWLGIEPVTFWFKGWCSIHWATSARTIYLFIYFTKLQR